MNSKYKQQYAKDNYHRVPLDLKIADYEKLKAAADKAGEPVNTFVWKAIEKRIGSQE